MTDTTDDERVPEGELAKILSISRSELHTLLHRHGSQIRFIHERPAPRRYSVADARAVVTPLLPELAERRQLAAERQAAEMAAAEARREERQRAHETHVARKAARARRRPATPPATSKPPSRGAPRPSSPEVIVRKR
jgi:hypothetical protein